MAGVEIWTIQIAQWRTLEGTGIELIDTTVKSGLPAFAPTWDMVLGHKDGTMSNERYTELYQGLMRHSWRDQQQAWLDLLAKPKIALACYCKPGNFCHRHILASYLLAAGQAMGKTVVLRGEYGKDSRG